MDDKRKLVILRNVLLIFLLAVGQNLSAQNSENVDSLYNWKDSPGTFYNDCWGYTAPDGSEYAIAGSRSKIYFFDFTDINNIQLIETLTPGASSSWRDFKTYDEYAYGVHDRFSGDGEGLVIMDLTDISNGNITFDYALLQNLLFHNQM